MIALTQQDLDILGGVLTQLRARQRDATDALTWLSQYQALRGLNNARVLVRASEKLTQLAAGLTLSADDLHHVLSDARRREAEQLSPGLTPAPSAAPPPRN